jgi:hypothetical protein
MCWSASVSLGTFLFSLVATILGVVAGVVSPALAVLFASFFTIQLIEAVAWTAIGRTCLVDSIGATGPAALAALVLLHLQPFAAIAFGLGSARVASWPWGRPLMWTLAAVYGVVLVLAIATYLPQLQKMQTHTGARLGMEPAPNGHLRWSFLDRPEPLNLAAYMVAFLVPVTLAAPPWISAIVWITLAASVVSYRTQGTWGTMWCWSANAISLVFLGLVVSNLFKK